MAADPDHAKLADFWVSANDEAAIEARGIEPLRPALALADAVAAAPPGSAERSAALGTLVATLGVTVTSCLRPPGGVGAGRRLCGG